MAFRRTCESVPRLLGRLRRRRSHSCSSFLEIEVTHAKSRAARLDSSSASSAVFASHNSTSCERETINYRHKRADFSDGSLSDMPPLPGALDHGAGMMPSRRMSAPVPDHTLPPLPARTPPGTPPGNPPLPRWGNYMQHQITSVAMPNRTAQPPSACSPPKNLQGLTWSKSIPNSSLILITVVSAVTGEFLAEVALPSTASVASLKLEIEKTTARSAFCLRFLREAGDSTECCCQDFDSLETALGGTVPVTLSLVLSQPNLDSSSCRHALPFDAKEREYLPASGLADSALPGQYRG